MAQIRFAQGNNGDRVADICDHNFDELYGASGYFSTATLVFLNEDTYVEMDVAHPDLSPLDVVSVSLAFSEDAILAEMNVGVVSQTPGVGFRIYGFAPNKATGSFVVNCRV